MRKNCKQRLRSRNYIFNVKEHNVEKGQIYEFTIEDMSTEGQGIGRAEGPDGLVVFVPGAVIGDRVRVELTKVKKNYALSKLLEVLEESDKRNTEFDCPYQDICGGCPYGRIEYSEQLKLKYNQVKNRLERLGGISFCESEAGPVLQPIIGMQESDNGDQFCFRYRNKAAMPVSTGGLMTRKGGIQEPVHEPRIGFRPPKSHDVIDCTDCYLQSIPAMAAADALRQFMAEDHICSYDKRWDKGLMKGMTVKTAFGTGEVMVILETTSKGIPNAAKLVELLDDAIYEATADENGETMFSLESVVVKYEKRNGKTGKVTGTENLVLAGKPTITDVVELEDNGRQLSFEISPDSFYQVNPAQMRRLYGKVREYCFPGNAKTEELPVILDLYCGIGTIGLCLADKAKHVHGIEIVKEAVLDANRNAVINGIVNATYTCGKAEEETLPEADIVILDPPRAGCRPELLQAAANTGADRIVYVSCDPATLARDVKLLDQLGYRLVEATPVDMFPHTSHCEVVVLLSRV